MELNKRRDETMDCNGLEKRAKIVLVVEKRVERSDPQCVLRVVTLEFLVNLQHVQQIRKFR